jgi:hypothetical protein
MIRFFVRLLKKCEIHIPNIHINSKDYQMFNNWKIKLFYYKLVFSILLISLSQLVYSQIMVVEEVDKKNY